MVLAFAGDSTMTKGCPTGTSPVGTGSRNVGPGQAGFARSGLRAGYKAGPPKESPVADTVEFFEKYLPAKITPELQASVKNSIQFDLTGGPNGPLTWTLDLSTAPGSVTQGAIAAPGCVITVAQSDWEKMLDNPGLAMQLFMMGKLKATNVALALQLQKILA